MTPDPSILTPDAVTIPGAPFRTGKVLDSATAIGQLVRGTIPSIDSRLATNPMAWNPVSLGDGLYFPKRDDVALIAIPPDGPEVLVWFQPAADASPDLPS